MQWTAPTQRHQKRKSEVSRTDSGSRPNGTAFKPEIVELLVAHLECTEEHARDLVERAVYGGSLEDIKSGSSPAQVRVEAGHEPLLISSNEPAIKSQGQRGRHGGQTPIAEPVSMRELDGYWPR